MNSLIFLVFIGMLAQHMREAKVRNFSDGKALLKVSIVDWSIQSIRLVRAHKRMRRVLAGGVLLLLISNSLSANDFSERIKNQRTVQTPSVNKPTTKTVAPDVSPRDNTPSPSPYQPTYNQPKTTVDTYVNEYDPAEDYVEDYDEDYDPADDYYYSEPEDYYEPCYGDCYDMDFDGRTWDDYDADGDGLYESRP
jgi:hypothetical protein